MMTDKEWEADADHFVLKTQLKKIVKNHSEEYASCFVNLDKVMRQLNNGHHLRAFHINFFKSEGKGLYRIGQTSVSPSMETRLYVCFNEEEKVCYILAVGGKKTQRSDIATCQKVASTLIK
ncbi:MAG: hypothetical protein V5783_01020 [Pontiella sp.]